MSDLFETFGQLLQWQVLIPWILGMVFGIFVGSTPGLTATMAVALLMPLSFHLPPLAGLAMILGVSFTAIFAGDIPATFLRIPGTPASTAATLDGYALQQQGKGGLAILLDLICSAVGGLIGVTLLILVAPQLASFALRFSNHERFWLAVLGLSMTAMVSQGSVLRGVLSATLGILLSTVGLGVFAVPRYTFSQSYLMNGIQFIPAMIGMFGLAEVFRNVTQPPQDGPLQQSRLRLPLREALSVVRSKFQLVLESGILGTVVGALPGAGADIAAWAAYGWAERRGYGARKFGTGEVAGVVAPTSANNAAVAGAWIPALVFGIPGDAVTAIVLGVLIHRGIRPGPEVFTQHSREIHGIFMIAILTQFFLLPAGWIGIQLFAQVLKMPRAMTLTLVTVFSVVGSYALNLSFFDVYTMFVFGIVGYFLERWGVPMVPLILGMILGPYLEDNFRNGMIDSQGSLVPFFWDPECGVLVTVLLLAFLWPLARRLIHRR